jgi:hypothetical protein
MLIYIPVFVLAQRLSSSPRSCGNGDAILHQEGNDIILLYTYRFIQRRFLNYVGCLCNAEHGADSGLRILSFGSLFQEYIL